MGLNLEQTHLTIDLWSNAKPLCINFVCCVFYWQSLCNCSGCWLDIDCAWWRLYLVINTYLLPTSIHNRWIKSLYKYLFGIYNHTFSNTVFFFYSWLTKKENYRIDSNLFFIYHKCCIYILFRDNIYSQFVRRTAYSKCSTMMSFTRIKRSKVLLIQEQQWTPHGGNLFSFPLLHKCRVVDGFWNK